MKTKSGFSVMVVLLAAALIAAVVVIVVLSRSKAPEAQTVYNRPVPSYQALPVPTGKEGNTGTDFSYITIYTSLNVEPVVYSPDGKEITGYDYFESPLTADDGSGEVAGEGLNVFSYPEPVEGKYFVKFIGRGTYQVDIRVYNKDGGLLTKVVEGQVGDNRLDELSITVDDNIGIDTSNY